MQLPRLNQTQRKLLHIRAKQAATNNLVHHNSSSNPRFKALFRNRRVDRLLTPTIPCLISNNNNSHNNNNNKLQRKLLILVIIPSLTIFKCRKEQLHLPEDKQVLLNQQQHMQMTSIYNVNSRKTLRRSIRQISYKNFLMISSLIQFKPSIKSRKKTQTLKTKYLIDFNYLNL